MKHVANVKNQKAAYEIQRWLIAEGNHVVVEKNARGFYDIFSTPRLSPPQIRPPAKAPAKKPKQANKQSARSHTLEKVLWTTVFIAIAVLLIFLK